MNFTRYNGWIGEGLADKLREHATKDQNKPLRWPILIATLLDEGYVIYLKKSKTTASRYIYVFDKLTSPSQVVDFRDGLKIRISNHPANELLVKLNDSDFYVGKNPVNGTWHTAEQAVGFVRWYYSDMNKNPKKIRLRARVYNGV